MTFFYELFTFSGFSSSRKPEILRFNETQNKESPSKQNNPQTIMSTISPTFKFIKIETVDSEPHVLTVTLNRPEKRNAINSVMWTEISKAFEYLGHRGDVRCILLKGAGSSFCSGIDFTDPKFGVSFDNSGDDDNTEEEEEPDTARVSLSLSF